MATNPFFSGRIPKGLDDRIEEYRKYTNESKSEVLIRALAKYVDYQLEETAPQIPPIREEFEKLYRRIEAIESQLSKKRNKLPKQLKITDDNEVITNNDKLDYQILSSRKTIEFTGVSQQSLSMWRRNNTLPKIYQNKESKEKFEIDIDKEKSQKRNFFWRVRKTDN